MVKVGNWLQIFQDNISRRVEHCHAGTKWSQKQEAAQHCQV